MQYLFSLRVILLFLFSCLFSNANGQAVPLSPRIANYEMHISLDTTSKSLIGNTQLVWKNISDIPISELHFHMYYNAFRNSRSTFFSERGIPEFLTRNIDNECGWGWTHISSFRDEKGRELRDSMYYFAPDDNNIHDKTVLVIKLAQPVLPGETQSFDFDWQAKIPKTMPRTGYNKEFYFMAQWFPKLGVLEPAGMRFAETPQWNCHQYHSNGEYYSDFGNYEVYLDVPSAFEVAASGYLAGQEKDGDRMIWHFSAHDVIDFSWGCSPHFELYRDQYKDTEICFYTYPYKAHIRERYFKTMKYAMNYLEERLGAYPYRRISIIDPPIHGMYTGGMEYPTLITSLSFCFFPKGFRTPETLSVHEFIHQYFMQMVATNETEEAWMDEGITSYYEARIMDSYLGENTSTIDFLGFKTGNKSFNRAEFFGMEHPEIASNAINSWEYTEGGYGEIAYNKAALWLQTLEGLIGIEHMDAIMKRYFDAWKFSHPCRLDFIEMVNEYVLENLSEFFPDGMDWFFNQVLYGTGICDYSIASIDQSESQADRGFMGSRDSCTVLENNSKKYRVKIELHRLEELYFPQEIKVVFEDGRQEYYSWDGKDSAHTLEFYTDKKVVMAHIDPRRKIFIDKNFINNSIDLRKHTKASRKISNRIFKTLQGILEGIALLI